MTSRTARILLLILAAAGAATATADDASFGVDRFQIVPGTSDLLVVEGARVPEAFTVNAHFALHWAKGLLELDRGGGRTELVGSGLAARLGGSVAIGGRYELGIVLPFAVTRDTSSGGILPAASTSGLEDVRLLPKVALPAWRDVRFAASLPVTLPIGKKGALLGEGSLTATPTGIAELALGPLRLAGNVGIAVRPRRQYYDLTVGSALVYGAGAEYPFRFRGWGWAALGSVWGEVGFLDGGSQAKPSELDAALRWEGPHGLDVTGGLGRGIVDGYGAPTIRVFVLAGWRPRQASAPKPPPAATVEPVEPVEPPAPPPAKPPEPPPAPAPVAKPIAEPPPPPPPPPPPAPPKLDPCAPGVKHEPEQCPALDEDGDGFVNKEDRCPLVKGLAEHQGCPPPRAVLTATRIELKEAVYFDVDKASIQERSFQLVDDISRILIDNPQVALVSIEGHTDASGSAEKNLILSQQRADAVKSYLVRKGIAAGRLVAKGFGQTRPVADNKTPAGKAKNRRVEFIVGGQ